MHWPSPNVSFSSPQSILWAAELGARAQDYRLLHVLARQPAMDLERSACELEDFVNRLTGERKKLPTFIHRFVLMGGLQLRTEIFRLDESPTYILVADAVAERVLRAGCTGMEFSDPDNLQSGTRVERYRTADGIAERRVGFLD